MRTTTLIVAALLAVLSIEAQQKTVLFDAMHAQTAGHADWVLDEDSCGTAQRFPTPGQSSVTSSTPETFWSGAFSAMGVDLVKKGFRVESLPNGSRVTFGDASNAQDLANYAVYVIPEPNVKFSAAEITAIRAFVQNGGGLLLICDHAGADRNSDGFDPPRIFNEIVGSPSVFGITFNANKSDRTLGWFDDHPNGNFTSSAASPIIAAGAFGRPTRGLGLFGSTSMEISGNAKGHIWRSGRTADVDTRGVTFATSTFGSGRVAAVGDSSPAEDATNNCGHNTHPGYTETQFDNALIFANAVAWLASGTTTVAPTAPRVSITAPANGTAVNGTVIVTASATDDVSVTKVELFADGALQSAVTAPPYTWNWDSTEIADGAHVLTAKAFDADGNVTTSAPVNVTVRNGSVTGVGLDIGGWTITQSNTTARFTFPAGTTIPANGFVVIGRDATRSEFEQFWGAPLPANVVYFNGDGTFPMINGSEKYALKNAAGAAVDGPTIAMPSSAGRTVKRTDPCAGASATSNWSITPTANATPGHGTAPGCAKGVVINEFSDASSRFEFEFVELHNDQ